jgi:hypothetical protein
MKLGTVEGANWLKQIIDTDRPARVFIDLGALGLAPSTSCIRGGSLTTTSSSG